MTLEQTYLLAIKNQDEELAERCWEIAKKENKEGELANVWCKYKKNDKTNYES